MSRDHLLRGTGRQVLFPKGGAPLPTADPPESPPEITENLAPVDLVELSLVLDRILEGADPWDLLDLILEDVDPETLLQTLRGVRDRLRGGGGTLTPDRTLDELDRILASLVDAPSWSPPPPPAPIPPPPRPETMRSGIGPAPAVPSPGWKIPKAVRKRIAVMALSGSTIKETADRFRISQSSVYRCLKDRREGLL